MSLALVVSYLGHRLRRYHGEAEYHCDHCGRMFRSSTEPADWCDEALGKASRKQ